MTQLFKISTINQLDWAGAKKGARISISPFDAFGNLNYRRFDGNVDLTFSHSFNHLHTVFCVHSIFWAWSVIIRWLRINAKHSAVENTVFFLILQFIHYLRIKWINIVNNNRLIDFWSEKNGAFQLIVTNWTVIQNCRFVVFFFTFQSLFCSYTGATTIPHNAGCLTIQHLIWWYSKTSNCFFFVFFFSCRLFDAHFQLYAIDDHVFSRFLV